MVDGHMGTSQWSPLMYNWAFFRKPDYDGKREVHEMHIKILRMLN